MMAVGGAQLSSIASPSAPGQRVALFTNNDDGWRTAVRSARAGVDVAADRRCRGRSRRRACRRMCAPTARVIRSARRSAATHGWPRLRAIDVATRGGSERDRCRYARDVGRLESRSRLDQPSWRPAGLERRRSGGLRAGQTPPGMTVGRRGQRSHCRSPTCFRDGARRRREGGRATRASTRPERRRRGRATKPTRLAPLWHVAASRRQGLRRFPERCHRRGHRAGRARRLPLGRASEALHHARHGDRPGQDLATSTALPSWPR